MMTDQQGLRQNRRDADRSAGITTEPQVCHQNRRDAYRRARPLTERQRYCEETTNRKQKKTQKGDHIHEYAYQCKAG